jgi:hypothetical protein
MRRLSAAGFKRDFSRVAVLPDWWDESCEDDPSLLPDVEIRIARFIGAPLTVVRDPSAPLVPPNYDRAQLRRVRDISRDRLGPAIHTALQVGAAAVRTMADVPPSLPPVDALAWRKQLQSHRPVIHLDDVLADLWSRGIPVLHLEALPEPTFQGLACVVESRPVILLGHDLDEPARLAFIIAHEVAHIVFRDCAPGLPVVDEMEEVNDDHQIEKRADDFAINVVTGGVPIPDLRASSYKDLALKAAAVEKQAGVDASAVVWSWARRSGDYAKARMAAQALYRTRGGKRLLRTHTDRNLDLSNASDSDRALLSCLHGDPDRNAAAS